MHLGRVGTDDRAATTSFRPRGCWRRCDGLGYAGIELGPPGYFGDDAESVVAALEPYGLALVGAFAPLRIADEDGFRDDLAFLDRTIEILAATGSRGPVVLAARRERDPACCRRPAGRPTRGSMSATSCAVPPSASSVAAQRALDRGVVAAFHPHTATYIESPEEVAALLEATDSDVVKIASTPGTRSSAAAIPSSWHGWRATGSRTST